MKQSIRNLCRDVRGANMVEYIILVGVIAVLAMAAFRTFGTSVQTKIGQQQQAVDTVNGSS